MNASLDSTAKTNLLGLTRAELDAFVIGMGEKPFRARQLLKWLYKRCVADFDQMTDLAKSFRERLKEVAVVSTPSITTVQVSADGTRKWLLAMDGTQGIETVFIPEPGRGTLCISSQVGCAMDCSFCSTAQQGFNRNLTVAEIVGQVWLANRELGFTPGGDRVVTNVVFMGMGEPLANYRNVVPAAEIMMDDVGFDISRRRVTGQHLRPRAADGAARRRDELRARRLAARAERRAARSARADQSQAQDRRAAGCLLAVREQAERPQHHVRST
jgi:23S rRNA (adenine2503-C2)-methyltransferase